jgi:hypothetical protein
MEKADSWCHFIMHFPELIDQYKETFGEIEHESDDR